VIKARLRSLEKSLGGIVEPFRGTIRIATFFDNEPIPTPAEGEELILLNIIRTPPPPRPPDPTNGRGTVAEDELAAQVKILEDERDALKARASERGSSSRPRRAMRGDGFRDRPRGNG
jgi:hypothetical protein